MTTEERLKWLETNQPTNAAAINAVRTKLGLPSVVKPLRKEKGFVIEPWRNWRQRGTSSN